MEDLPWRAPNVEAQVEETGVVVLLDAGLRVEAEASVCAAEVRKSLVAVVYEVTRLHARFTKKACVVIKHCKLFHSRDTSFGLRPCQAESFVLCAPTCRFRHHQSGYEKIMVCNSLLPCFF